MRLRKLLNCQPGPSIVQNTTHNPATPTTPKPMNE